MKRHLHLIALVLFLAALFYDLVVWGALPRMDEAGSHIATSVRKETWLGAAYVTLGNPLDAAVPALQRYGEAEFAKAIEPGLEPLREQNYGATDLFFSNTWNAQHRWLKTAYLLPPILLALTAVLWAGRSRKVDLFRQKEGYRRR